MWQARSITVCAQAGSSGGGTRSDCACSENLERLVTPVETAENIPSLLIQRNNHWYHSSRVGWFSLACVQTPLPPPLSKNRRRSPFSDFYWGEVGGICTQARFAVLYLKKIYTAIARRKSIPIIQPGPAYSLRIFSKRGAYHKISQPANLANFLFPSQVKFCLKSEYFVGAAPLGTPAENFFKTILLANNLPMYLYTYVVPPRGGVTPLYRQYRYVPRQRVWFFSRFGLK